jgi:orotate phosphoribosyltransferase
MYHVGLIIQQLTLRGYGINLIKMKRTNPYSRLTFTDIAGLLNQYAVIQQNGHFVGTSGKHLSEYVDKDAVGRNPALLDHFAFELAHRLCEGSDLADPREDIIAVIGAPMGAIAFSSMVCYWINELYPRRDGVAIQSLYAEKGGPGKDDPFKIRASFAEIIKGRGVISIEDILNSGLSARKMVQAILAAGGKPRRCGVLCNRGGILPEDINVPWLAGLYNVQMSAYDLSNAPCPMCESGTPINTKFGHGAKYVEIHGQPNKKTW